MLFRRPQDVGEADGLLPPAATLGANRPVRKGSARIQHQPDRPATVPLLGGSTAAPSHSLAGRGGRIHPNNPRAPLTATFLPAINETADPLVNGAEGADSFRGSPGKIAPMCFLVLPPHRLNSAKRRKDAESRAHAQQRAAELPLLSPQQYLDLVGVPKLVDSLVAHLLKERPADVRRAVVDFLRGEIAEERDSVLRKEAGDAGVTLLATLRKLPDLRNYDFASETIPPTSELHLSFFVVCLQQMLHYVGKFQPNLAALATRAFDAIHEAIYVRPGDDSNECDHWADFQPLHEADNKDAALQAMVERMDAHPLGTWCEIAWHHQWECQRRQTGFDNQLEFYQRQLRSAELELKRLQERERELAAAIQKQELAARGVQEERDRLLSQMTRGRTDMHQELQTWQRKATELSHTLTAVLRETEAAIEQSPAIPAAQPAGLPGLLAWVNDTVRNHPFGTTNHLHLTSLHDGSKDGTDTRIGALLCLLNTVLPQYLPDTECQELIHQGDRASRADAIARVANEALGTTFFTGEQLLLSQAGGGSVVLFLSALLLKSVLTQQAQTTESLPGEKHEVVAQFENQYRMAQQRNQQRWEWAQGTVQQALGFVAQRGCDDLGGSDDQLRVMELLQAAEQAALTGDLLRAVQYCSEAVELVPQMPTPYYRRCQYRHQLADFDGARSDYAHAVWLDPNSRNSYHSIEPHRRRGAAPVGHHGGPEEEHAVDNEFAAKLLTFEFGQPAEEEPETPCSPRQAEVNDLLQSATRMAQHGELAEAIALCNKALEVKPFLATSYFRRGELRHQMDDFDGARQDYARASFLSLSARDSYHTLAELRDEDWLDGKRTRGHHGGEVELNRNENLAKTLDYTFRVNGLEEGDETRVTALVAFADEKAREKDYPAAIDALDNAIDINPANSPLYFKRGSLRHVIGDHEGARQDYEKGAWLDPDARDGHHAFHPGGRSKTIGHHGTLLQYNDLKQRTAAAGAQEESGGFAFPEAQGTEQDLRGYLEFAEEKAEGGDVQLAIEACDQAAKLMPTYAPTYFRRGSYRHQIGDFDGAGEDYRNASMMQPTSRDGYHALRSRDNPARGRQRTSAAENGDAYRYSISFSIPETPTTPADSDAAKRRKGSLRGPKSPMDEQGKMRKQSSIGASALRDVREAAKRRLQEVLADLPTIDFEPNSAKLRGNDVASLNAVAGIMQEFPTVRLQVTGVTVNENKLQLANRRSEACISYLVRRGIAVIRLEPRGIHGDRMATVFEPVE
eukprot:TRINITY_DN14759_c0_g1_i1.p1 TRINITY_DN14759_c0_g1~~TRINITY_DN14759_c0_g1_i1.p1  ORF type:complete len:1252 (+),score=207.70 TRINITY_DN14759_c0_g1_i1:48-3803(+)